MEAFRDVGFASERLLRQLFVRSTALASRRLLAGKPEAACSRLQRIFSFNALLVNCLATALAVVSARTRSLELN